MTTPPNVVYKRRKLETEYDGIVILDGLSPDERTEWKGALLVQRLVESSHVPCPILESNTKAEFLFTLDRLHVTAAKGKKVLLHFDCHGSTDGIQMGMDTVLWAEFAPKLEAINYRMGGDLVLNVSACKGIHGIKSVDPLRTGDPFFGIVGPMHSPTFTEANEINQKFYFKLTDDVDLSAIVKQINAEAGGDDVLFIVSSEGYRQLKARTSDG